MTNEEIINRHKKYNDYFDITPPTDNQLIQLLNQARQDELEKILAAIPSRDNTLEAGTKYADEKWKVHERPNEHDNAREDFILGAIWMREKIKEILSDG